MSVSCNEVGGIVSEKLLLILNRSSAGIGNCTGILKELLIKVVSIYNKSTNLSLY